ERDLGLTPHGVLCGDADVTGHSQFTPAPERRSVDGGDDRLRYPAKFQLHGLDHEDVLLRASRVERPNVMEVSSPHEAATRAGDHDAPHVRPAPEIPRRFADLPG